MSQTRHLSDKSLQRRLLALAHPDGSGDHDLFIFTKDALDRINALEEEQHDEESNRIPYPDTESFGEVTTKALSIASERSDYVGKLLGLLADCFPTERLMDGQEHGASYKRLAEIGHLVGMDLSERSRWYRVCESIPLSDRHASHILGYLKRRAS